MAANCNLQGAPLAEGPLHPAGILTTFIYYVLYTYLYLLLTATPLGAPPSVNADYYAVKPRHFNIMRR